MAESAFCTQCGAALRAHCRFCTQCGAVRRPVTSPASRLHLPAGIRVLLRVAVGAALLLGAAAFFYGEAVREHDEMRDAAATPPAIGVCLQMETTSDGTVTAWRDVDCSSADAEYVVEARDDSGRCPDLEFSHIAPGAGSLWWICVRPR